jgi:hypothetical protein
MSRDRLVRGNPPTPLSKTNTPPTPKTRSGWLNRRVGLAAGLTLLVIALGCMSFSIERPEHVTYVGNDAVLEQKGEVTIHSGQIVDVYYPIPYGSPPNLTIDDSFHHYEVIDQKPDFFPAEKQGGLARGQMGGARHPHAGPAAAGSCSRRTAARHRPDERQEGACQLPAAGAGAGWREALSYSPVREDHRALDRAG